MPKFSGLSKQVVEDISAYKEEPQWMKKLRLKALEHFERRYVFDRSSSGDTIFSQALRR